MNESTQNFILNNSSNSTEITKIINYTSDFTNNSSISFLNTSNTTYIISQIDPNWFYSASAQSAAAIVGLMGAFIITKLINHKSFVNQLQKEITECNNKIDSIYREINPKNQYIDNLDDETNNKLVDDFLDFCKPVIDPNNPLDLDNLYVKSQEIEEYQDIDKNALERNYNSDYLDEVRVYSEELVNKFLGEVSSDIDPNNPLDLTDLFKLAKENKDYKFIQESVLDEKYKEYISKISKKMEKPIGFASAMRAMLDSYPISPLPAISLISSLPNLVDIEANKRKWEKYRRYKEEVTEKKAELSYYEYLLHDKKNTLGDKRDIMILRDNIITLLLFSVAGIFIPLFMMLCDYDVMMKYRQETFVVILIGWMLVVLNLGADIWHLFKNTKD